MLEMNKKGVLQRDKSLNQQPPNDSKNFLQNQRNKQLQ